MVTKRSALDNANSRGFGSATEVDHLWQPSVCRCLLLKIIVTFSETHVFSLATGQVTSNSEFSAQYPFFRQTPLTARSRPISGRHQRAELCGSQLTHKRALSLHPIWRHLSIDCMFILVLPTRARVSVARFGIHELFQREFLVGYKLDCCRAIFLKLSVFSRRVSMGSFLR